MDKEIVIRIAEETDKAYLCLKKRKSGKVTYWLPKSHVKIIDEMENRMTGYVKTRISIPEWLYDKTFGEWDKNKLQKKAQQNPKARIYGGLNTNAM